ncbi:DNA topoisomerase IV subunit B [Pseudovibrio sp. Ad26]|uniref:DNA topoisomerase IV subunit B n=1 Tax=Pseudovibrio sp. Ad26 TaxID=989410 RepID=UPI0007AEA163|nr:DNA topoisomerase IV subunit B [Pseudovibrio sp. Ad26]KZL10659.1 DNA topoisomerase 4 subunit B [Pseudovibrio sp. Ad26]
MSTPDDLFADVTKSMDELTSSSGSTEKKQAPAASAPTSPAKPSSAGKAAPVGAEGDYTAADIEVLEGLEPVRRRPGMYIGGTDEKALHHLFAEVIDNSMDEAVAGHASWIDVSLGDDGYLTITDNGRGIPIDPHPKYKDKSALEVIMTTLHAGGKFDSKVYETSGGLHGVGISVVNALSEELVVEVARNRKLYRQTFRRGLADGGLELVGDVHNRRGTMVRFKPDAEIFGKTLKFKPVRLMKMARSKAYLFGGVEIRWRCAKALADEANGVPETATFHFPGGLKDYLEEALGKERRVTDEVFAGRTQATGKHGSVEWAVAWFAGDGFVNSYCNTVPTPEGGTHETGLRYALLRGLKAYGELIGNKKASIITGDDVLTSAAGMLSVFVREPEFVGQTKDKLATNEATRIAENAVRDAFDHWLTASPNQANKLLEWVVDRAEERLKRRQEKDVARKTAVRRLRLPGKLADCSTSKSDGTELFIVEGDSAGGSAKQARNRATQAVLPLRGKILNVANAGRDKLVANQLLSDLIQALGCGTRSHYDDKDLRYERIVIMTDADVDGAHIAALLITFFYKEMPDLVNNGHLYLAVPPLYRISQGGKTLYARDDAHREQLLKTSFKKNGKIEIGRFKGLGEMLPAQLKETTMDPKRRTLLKVVVGEDEVSETRNAVEQLMGNKPEARFNFIQERAEFATDLDI